ncbi:hypothetical protein [Mycolicibacterium sp. P1-5]|uniref:hypothetical protein n=1 Tax=Mycolicibacterium sp. P1-5 TaxID=2024617 RepID=UPI0011F005BF|nr:hypothetical protein [Mycolicibacterium sp. P1-5]KAA0110782.1 hypothetical protein CIW47_07240 [Mycolicibacterium sp. P1-5]
MSIAARPHTKLAAALMTAGVIAAAPAAVGVTPETTLALSNIAVRNTSVVTDVLYNFGDVVNAVTNAAVIATDAVVGLNFYTDDSDFGQGVPWNPVFAALAAAQNPAAIGSVLSYIAQLYLNPSYNNPNYTYAWFANDYVLQQLADLLPAPLSTTVSGAINGLADGINDAFANLPDPAAAVNSLAAMYSTVPGRLVYAVQSTLGLPVFLAADVAYWAAYVPGDLEATAESAIQNPTQIPGLLSNLVYNVFDPNLGSGLLGNLARDIAKPFFYLPSPIGESAPGVQDGLAWNLYNGFVTAVDGLLSNLPAPITPTPFPSAAAAASAASAVPTASAAVKAKDAAATENSASSDLTSTDQTDGAKADVQTADTPDIHAQVRPGRKAVTPERKSAKQSQASKSDSHPSGQGRSARSGKSGNAA